MSDVGPLSLDLRVAAWGLAGLVVAVLEFQYGMALHLGEFLITLGISDVRGYVRMSDFSSPWGGAHLRGRPHHGQIGAMKGR
jgi:hypothetical protein